MRKIISPPDNLNEAIEEVSRHGGGTIVLHPGNYEIDTSVDIVRPGVQLIVNPGVQIRKRYNHGGPVGPPKPQSMGGENGIG